MAGLKMDIENFEYDSRYSIMEHRWCALHELKNQKLFYKKRDEQDMERFHRSRVQSDPETTGQYGTML